MSPAKGINKTGAVTFIINSIHETNDRCEMAAAACSHHEEAADRCRWRGCMRHGNFKIGAFVSMAELIKNGGGGYGARGRSISIQITMQIAHGHVLLTYGKT